MWQPTLPGMSQSSHLPESPRLRDIYYELPPEERTTYLDALNDRTLPAEKLVQALSRFEIKVSASLIRTHRRTHGI